MVQVSGKLLKDLKLLNIYSLMVLFLLNKKKFLLMKNKNKINTLLEWVLKWLLKKIKTINFGIWISNLYPGLMVKVNLIFKNKNGSFKVFYKLTILQSIFHLNETY